GFSTVSGASGLNSFTDAIAVLPQARARCGRAIHFSSAIKISISFGRIARMARPRSQLAAADPHARMRVRGVDVARNVTAVGAEQTDAAVLLDADGAVGLPVVKRAAQRMANRSHGHLTFWA